MKNPKVSHAFATRLLETKRGASVALKELERFWPTVELRVHRQREKLGSRIARNDPIRSRIDLLSPIRRAFDETIHTQALAYLLSPTEAHGFGKAGLQALLGKMPRGSGAKRIGGLLNQKRTSITVTPEYRWIIQDSPTRSAGRCDIWIELRNKQRNALIILENKIEAPQGHGQLAWYETEARKWTKTYAGPILLIYLTKYDSDDEKAANSAWHPLSYLALASALRSIWQTHRSAPGIDWLGLYISAVTRGVLGMSVDGLQDTTMQEIGTYLGQDR